MTTNETIARWRGWVHTGTPRPWLSPNDERFSSVPKYDEWPASWHGEKGLLGDIERRGKWLRFIKTLAEVCGDAGIEASLGNALVTPLSPEDVWGAIWTMLRATTSQLAAALVEVIGEK